MIGAAGTPKVNKPAKIEESPKISARGRPGGDL